MMLFFFFFPLPVSSSGNFASSFRDSPSSRAKDLERFVTGRIAIPGMYRMRPSPYLGAGWGGERDFL